MIICIGNALVDSLTQIEESKINELNLNKARMTLVDIWTMTGGGFTTREMFPIGFCEFIKINNVFSHIQSLKILD